MLSLDKLQSRLFVLIVIVFMLLMMPMPSVQAQEPETTPDAVIVAPSADEPIVVTVQPERALNITPELLMFIALLLGVMGGVYEAGRRGGAAGMRAELDALKANVARQNEIEQRLYESASPQSIQIARDLVLGTLQGVRALLPDRTELDKALKSGAEVFDRVTDGKPNTATAGSQ
jgi:hypothetical protein